MKFAAIGVAIAFVFLVSSVDAKPPGIKDVTVTINTINDNIVALSKVAKSVNGQSLVALNNLTDAYKNGYDAIDLVQDDSISSVDSKTLSDLLENKAGTLKDALVDIIHCNVTLRSKHAQDYFEAADQLSAEITTFYDELLLKMSTKDQVMVDKAELKKEVMAVKAAYQPSK